MAVGEKNLQYIFPELERTVFIKSNYFLVPLELILHSICIGSSIEYQNLDGVYISLFFAVIFAIVHFQNLRFRKYCLATWSFDGIAFHVHIKNEKRSVDLSQPFCVSGTSLSFNRRYSVMKYPFIMIWRPGAQAPYEDMNGYMALKKRNVVLIPMNEVTIALISAFLHVSQIPTSPKSAVCPGIAESIVR